MTEPFQVKPTLGRCIPEAINPQDQDELRARDDRIYVG
jgi:hypothetical protein